MCGLVRHMSSSGCLELVRSQGGGGSKACQFRNFHRFRVFFFILFFWNHANSMKASASGSPQKRKSAGRPARGQLQLGGCLYRWRPTLVVVTQGFSQFQTWWAVIWHDTWDCFELLMLDGMCFIIIFHSRWLNWFYWYTPELSPFGHSSNVFGFLSCSINTFVRKS